MFDIKSYGAEGDGLTDDTKAIQDAINDLDGNGGGQIYIPTGEFKVTETLVVRYSKNIEIVGNGLSSQIAWSFDGTLFRWDVSAEWTSIRNFKVSPKVKMDTSSWAFDFTQGCERSTIFDHVIIQDLGYAVGSGIRMANNRALTNVDTVAIRDCFIGVVIGTGISLGAGSQIDIRGGRIIGDGATNQSVGIHLTGNNGGVHIVTTDIIAHHIGVLIDNKISLGSNREVFITHATLDACTTGLLIDDSSYVSVSGCWAASCFRENILIQHSNPLLIINGGTIFNAGAIAMEPGRADGLVANSGSFILQGVAIRNNKGRAVWVPNPACRKFIISGCKIYSNRMGLDLTAGSQYVVILRAVEYWTFLRLAKVG